MVEKDERTGGVQVQMDVREKIDYMIQCLQVANEVK